MTTGDDEYTSLDFLSKVQLLTFRFVCSPKRTSSNTCPWILTSNK
jgi:hypothetical protein